MTSFIFNFNNSLLSMKHSQLTYSQKQTIVALAKTFKKNQWKERNKKLREIAPKDFYESLKDYPEKLRRWERETKPDGHQCSYGDFIDIRLRDRVIRELDSVKTKHEQLKLMNIDILRNMLQEECLKYDSAFNIDACGYFYGPSWAQVWAIRHELPSFVHSILNTSFAKNGANW
jgi:hypothetical protein